MRNSRKILKMSLYDGQIRKSFSGIENILEWLAAGCGKASSFPEIAVIGKDVRGHVRQESRVSAGFARHRRCAFCAYCSKIPCVSLLDIGNERCYNKIVIEYGGILPKLQTKHENQTPIRSSRSAAVHGRHLQTANTSKERHLLWAHSPIS